MKRINRGINIINISIVIVLLLVSVITAQPQISISKTIVNMGDTIKVDLINKRPLTKKKIGFAGRSFELIRLKKKKGKYRYRAYVAASRKLKTNSYPLKVYYQEANQPKGVQQFQIQVNHPEKRKGKVTLSRKKNRLSKSQKQLQKEARIITKGFKQMSSKPYFKYSFIMPAKGKLTSGFGVQREYNGSYQRSHAGVDIANKVNTRVVAPNHGKVVLSKRLKIHGNTVMIDHGMGIVTIYNHLHQRKVRHNQVVKKGDLIGVIGKTGVATGPHLHWGMSVQNVRVDPLFWVKKNKFLYD